MSLISACHTFIRTLLIGYVALIPTTGQGQVAANSQKPDMADPIQAEPSSAPPNTQALAIPLTPPAEALKMMELPSGFKSTMFAAEPDVHQPIAITTDSRGRLWVAECYTYSDGKENYNLELNDRISIFTDSDHDGVFDQKKIFWDAGKKLTSVEVGFGGVWVTAAPNLIFIPDRDGDDVPDGEPEILLDGFDGDVIRHNIVNGLRWGPDGWLYGRHGIQATSLVGPPGATASQRMAMNCAIWRFHPVSHQFEIVAAGGTNSWGFDFNEHGEMFMINTVIGHLFHVVPGARFARMYGSHFNPHTYQVIEQTADHFHWDVGEENWSVAKKEGLSDATDIAGGGHAHCGLMIYQGDNWPNEFAGKLFTANFHGRRINSDSVQREGNSYVGHHGPDYFKTTDPWFRGIEMISGPDGGVFLLDWSDIGECHENDGIHRTSGRIFKLMYGDLEPPQFTDLALLETRELIQLLGHRNDWYCRQARRILQERCSLANSASTENTTENREVSRLLMEAYSAAEPIPTKLKILWAMYSCDCLSTDWLISQTEHADEHVRVWAVRLLTDGRLPITEAVNSRLEKLATEDVSGLVRLYLASALSRLESSVVFRVAFRLATRSGDADDRAQPKLIWYGIEPHVVTRADLAISMAVESKMPLLRTNIARRLTSEIESQPAVVEMLVQQLSELARQNSQVETAEILAGMSLALEGWNQAPAPASWSIVAEKLVEINDPKIATQVQKLSLVFGDGRALDDLKKIVADNKADTEARRQAISALVNAGKTDGLMQLLQPLITDKSLANDAVRGLAVCDHAEVAKLILDRFKHFDPEGKSAAINTLVVREDWALRLLQAVEAKQVPVSLISAAHARQIKNFENEKLTEQLVERWGQIRESSAERQQQMARLRDELTQRATMRPMSTDELLHGQTIYEKTCASCHALRGAGGKIGPDLTGSDRKNLNYLLENVVDPSASVAESYRASIVVLDDGRLFTGVIVMDNERTIQLQTAEQLLSLDRRSVDTIKKTDRSLMPDGLLDNLSESEIGELFGFLAN